MAKGINKVILIGNLGNDPEVRYTPSGNAIANVTLATSESWKDKQTGEKKERTEWHRVVFFNRLGEIAGEYLTKGSKVYIEGQIRTKKWQDDSGQDRYTTQIIASEMQMLDSRNNGSGQQSNQGNAHNPNANQGNNGFKPQQQNNQNNQNQQRQQQAEPAGFDDFDDDIPF